MPQDQPSAPFPVVSRSTALRQGSGSAMPPDTALKADLDRIYQEIYQRNTELALRNRTLSTISKIYQIITTSLGIEETSERLVDAIVTELGFLKCCIAVLDPSAKELKVIAVSHSAYTNKEQQTADEALKKLVIPLRNEENLCVKCANQKKRRLTNSLHDLMVPYFDVAQSAAFQERLGLQTIIVDPILFAGDVLGVLVLGMGKHIGYLSKAEFEAIRGIIDIVAIALERAQIYKDLKDANEKLKASDQLKDEFVSVASHELRTPMTAIRSYLWMLLEGNLGGLNEKQQAYLDRAYTSTTRLIKLVNDMLNISRIESGRISIEVKKVDLQVLAAEVIHELTPRTEEVGVRITLTSNPQLPPVIADADKIGQVLINLIGNSLKFTPRGGAVTVSFRVEDELVITSVTDTGIGLLKEDVPQLFRKFGMVKSSYVVNEQAAAGGGTGTGLGLYICKSIIELHGGKIWASSPGTNQGAIFSFSLRTYSDGEFKNLQDKYRGKGEVGLVHAQIE